MIKQTLGVQYWLMMNNLKSSLLLALNKLFWRTILINNEKKQTKITNCLLWTHILNSSQYRNLLILTARPHNLLRNSIFKRIHVLITDKLKSSQLKYLLMRIILTLFEELYKTIGLAVYFSNILQTPSQRRNYKQRFYWKSWKCYEACKIIKIILQ